MVYILTNLEAEATHKVLTNLTPGADNSLPESERQTLRTLITKLTTAINNGLPDDNQPPMPGQELPTPPPVVSVEPPKPVTPPPVVDAKPPEPPKRPDHDLPEHAKPKK